LDIKYVGPDEAVIIKKPKKKSWINPFGGADNKSPTKTSASDFAIGQVSAPTAVTAGSEENSKQTDILSEV